MTKLKDRIARLMPNGIPRYVRCYDNGSESADRYTVCYTGNYRNRGPASNEYVKGWYLFVAMSPDPFHPQGVGQHGESEDRQIDTNKSGYVPAIGRKCHLGTRIAFSKLPESCQKLVRADYATLWNL